MPDGDGAIALPSTFFPSIQFLPLTDKYKGASVQDISCLGCISADRAVLLNDCIHGAIALKSAASLQSETALFSVDVSCKMVLRSWNIKAPASMQGFIETCFAAHVVLVCAIRFSNGELTHGMMYPFLGGLAVVHVGAKLPSPAVQAAFEERKTACSVAQVTPLGPNAASVVTAHTASTTVSNNTPPRFVSVPGRSSSSSSSSVVLGHPGNLRLSPCLPPSGERRPSTPSAVVGSGNKSDLLLNRASSFGRYNRIQKLVSSSSPREGLGASSPSSDCSDAASTTSQRLLRLIRSSSSSPMNANDEEGDLMSQERDILTDELARSQCGKLDTASDATHWSSTPPSGGNRLVEAGVFVTPGSPAALGTPRSNRSNATVLVDTPMESESFSEHDDSLKHNIDSCNPSTECTMLVVPEGSPAPSVTRTPQASRRAGTPGSRDADRVGEGTLLFYSPESFSEEIGVQAEEEGDGSRSLLGEFKDESIVAGAHAAVVGCNAPSMSAKDGGGAHSASGSTSLFSEVMQRVSRGLGVAAVSGVIESRAGVITTTNNIPAVISTSSCSSSNAVTLIVEPSVPVHNTAFAVTCTADDPGASLQSHDVPSITSASDKSDSHIGDDESKSKFSKLLRSMLKIQPGLSILEKEKVVRLGKILENGFIYLVNKPCVSSRSLLKFVKDICKSSKGNLFYLNSQDIVLNICKLLSRLDMKFSDLVNSVTEMRSPEHYQSLLALQLVQVYFLLDLLSSYDKINGSNDFEKQVTKYAYKAFDNFRFWADEDHCGVSKDRSLLTWCLPSDLPDLDALMALHTVEVVTSEGIDEDRIDLLALLSVVFNRQYSHIKDVIVHLTEQQSGTEEGTPPPAGEKVKAPDTSLVEQFASFLKPRRQLTPANPLPSGGLGASGSRSLFRSRSLNSLGMEPLSPAPDSRLSFALGGFDDIMISSSDMFGAFDIPMPDPSVPKEVLGPARVAQVGPTLTPGSAQKISASPSSTNPLLAGSNRSKINGHRTNMDQRLTRTVSTAPPPLRPSSAVSGQTIGPQRSSGGGVASQAVGASAIALRPPLMHPVPPRPRGSKITDYAHPTTSSSSSLQHLSQEKLSVDLLHTPTSEDKRTAKRSRSFVVEDTPISKLRR